MRDLLAEVGRGVFFFGANLGFGFDAQVAVERVAVAGVGGHPQRTRQGFAIVAERQLQAVDGRGAMRAVGVVELGIADAHLHVGHAGAARGTFGQRSVLRANGDKAGIRDRVAEEVGRQLLAVGDGDTCGCDGPGLPSEVKARCSSVVMASRRTDVPGRCARATTGSTSSAMTAAAGARIKNRAVRRRGIAMEPLGVGIRFSGEDIFILDCRRIHEAYRNIHRNAIQDGITAGDKRNIDNAYEEYDEEFPGRREHERKFRATIDAISAIYDGDLAQSEFRAIRLLYPLFCAVYHFKYGLPGFKARRALLRTNDYPKAKNALDGIDVLIGNIKEAESEHEDIELSTEDRRFYDAMTVHWVHADKRATLTEYICRKLRTAGD